MLLSKELLAKIRKLQIKTDRLASEILVGEYKSAFRGKGLNFDTIREYLPGDDLRLIDWKVTARMSEPFVRQYKEERQLTIMLLLDLSASNNFGTSDKNKKELATELAAILASLAIKNNDRVGLILFTDQIESFIAPKKGKSHVFRIIKELMTYKPRSQGTDFKSVLAGCMNMIPRHSVVFVISDFVPNKAEVEVKLNGIETQNWDFEKELKILNKAQDLVAVSVRDPREFSLPNIGYIEILNPETGKKQLMNLNRKGTRDLFKHTQEEYFSGLIDKLRSLEVDFLDIRTDKPYIAQLLNFFLMREHRS